MAGGGREFSYEDLELDKKLDHDDNDEEEVNRTRPSQPGVLYHREIEMQTMQHEQSGLPDTSYQETPLFSDFLDEDKRQTMIEAAKENIRDHFPNVNFGELPPISFSKEGNGTEIVLLKGRSEERIFYKKASR